MAWQPVPEDEALKYWEDTAGDPKSGDFEKDSVGDPLRLFERQFLKSVAAKDAFREALARAEEQSGSSPKQIES